MLYGLGWEAHFPYSSTTALDLKDPRAPHLRPKWYVLACTELANLSSWTPDVRWSSTFWAVVAVKEWLQGTQKGLSLWLVIPYCVKGSIVFATEGAMVGTLGALKTCSTPSFTVAKELCRLWVARMRSAAKLMRSLRWTCRNSINSAEGRGTANK